MDKDSRGRPIRKYRQKPFQHYLKFTQGHPVPDDVPYSEITLENHPSNIEVFRAANLKEATLKAMHAFRHAKQGAVWLENTTCSYVERAEDEDGMTNFYQDDLSEQVYRLRKAVLLNDERVLCDAQVYGRCEQQGIFGIHMDNEKPRFMPSYLRSPKISSFRLLFNVMGIGTVIFGKNTVLAARLQGIAGEDNLQKITSDDLGEAFICPRGSALFILGGEAGYSNALLHSSPNKKAKDKNSVTCIKDSVVRELQLVDFSFSRFY